MRDCASSKKATWRHWRGSKSLPIRRFRWTQRVAVEGRGDAERVVVGGLENGARLDQVDADQQAAAAGALRARARRKASASSGVKLPMLEPG